jgi:hypothetical protein
MLPISNHAASLEEQIDQWRSYLRHRQAIHAVDVVELEDHLREQVGGLVDAGLATDEAYLVAVKRMGDLERQPMHGLAWDVLAAHHDETAGRLKINPPGTVWQRVHDERAVGLPAFVPPLRARQASRSVPPASEYHRAPRKSTWSPGG